MPAAKKSAPPVVPPAKDASNTQTRANKKRALEEEQDGPPANAEKRVKTTSDGPASVPVDETQDDDSEESEEGGEEQSGDDEDDDDSILEGGDFDLYDMNLDFLNSKYSPPGKKDVDPEALYRTILTYQAKNDRTAKVTIPVDYSVPRPCSDGEFSARFLRDPMSDEPFEICVSDIQVRKDDIGFRSKYAAPKAPWEGDAITARMEIARGGCGIASSSGSFAMKPLWLGETEDGEYMELYEGTLTFRATFSPLYTRKGHGRGIPTISFPFWAVRALE